MDNKSCEEEINEEIKEVKIQRKMEKELGGKHQACLAGVADIVTEKEVIEIKKWKNWKEALGQILAYKLFFPDKSPKVHFFGKFPKHETQMMIFAVFTHYKITVTWEAQKYERMML